MNVNIVLSILVLLLVQTNAFYLYAVVEIYMHTNKNLNVFCGQFVL